MAVSHYCFLWRRDTKDFRRTVDALLMDIFKMPVS
jgi:hypothetical protein